MNSQYLERVETILKPHMSQISDRDKTIATMARCRSEGERRALAAGRQQQALVWAQETLLDLVRHPELTPIGPDDFEALVDNLVHRLAEDAADFFSLRGYQGWPDYYDAIYTHLMTALPKIARQAVDLNERRYLGKQPQYSQNTTPGPPKDLPSQRVPRPEICFVRWGPMDGEPTPLTLSHTGFILANDGTTAHDVSIEDFSFGDEVWTAEKIARIKHDSETFSLVSSKAAVQRWNLLGAIHQAWSVRGGAVEPDDSTVKIHARYRDAVNTWYQSWADLTYIPAVGPSLGQLRFGPTAFKGFEVPNDPQIAFTPSEHETASELGITVVLQPRDDDAISAPGSPLSSDLDATPQAANPKIELLSKILATFPTTLAKWAASHKFGRTTVYDWRRALRAGRSVKGRVGTDKCAEIEAAIEEDANALGLASSD